MKKWIYRMLIIAGVLYIAVCTLLYLFQEKLIFFPNKLDKAHQFGFLNTFEELSMKAGDGTTLHGVLFKTGQDSCRGLIFYLHGNGGSVDGWGGASGTYTGLGYDVFILDYRGYGKSEGVISSEEQFYSDIQMVYEQMMKRYPEEKIVVLGYSIGTGPATMLASANKPRLLLLHAPYYSLVDMMQHKFPMVPTFILKYKFSTYEYLQKCKMPVVIFHGDADEIVYYGSSIKLKQHFKTKDTLITLAGGGHNGITEREDYVAALEKMLNRR